MKLYLLPVLGGFELKVAGDKLIFWPKKMIQMNIIFKENPCLKKPWFEKD